MAFKDLEDRYNQTVNTLYAGATQKFNNGRSSNGRTDNPLIVRRPGDRYVGSVEQIGGRMLPVSSAQQDVRRLTLFQLKPEGIRFLAKQQLLQTGNTFEVTRLINPAFVIANAVPFLHIKRNLRPLKNLIGKTDTSYENVKKLGQLQVGTYNAQVKKWKVPSYITPSSTNKSNLFSKLGNSIKNAATSVLDTATSLINPKMNVGDKFGYDAKGWKQSRPELAPSNMVQVVSEKNKLYQNNVSNLFITEIKESTPFIKYFTSPDGIKNIDEGVPADDSSPKSLRGDRASIANAVTTALTLTGRTKKISYIKDPLNTPRLAPGAAARTRKLTFYNDLPGEQIDDIILVSIAMGNDDPVQFRAFITDINQTASPEYKSYQYIGRIEKFVTYAGVQREVSFKLGVIAFSKDELKQVWKRINYLTGTVYPYGTHKGVLQPNIIKLTIGDVYKDQPGYITSLNTNFTQLSESWEIDKNLQVPIAAQIDMKFVLIEKTTKTAGDPFYGITENMPRTTSSPPRVGITPSRSLPFNIPPITNVRLPQNAVSRP